MRRVSLLLFLGLRQLWNRRGLNAIAVSGVALGVVVFVAIGSLFRGQSDDFKTELLRTSPHVVLFSRESTSLRGHADALFGGGALVHVIHEQPTVHAVRIDRPTEVVRAIESLRGVEAACPVVTGGASAVVGRRQHAIDIRGINPMDYLRCTQMANFIVAGSWNSLASDGEGVVIGTALADDMGVSVGDRILAVAPGGPSVTLRIKAIFETTILPIDRSRIYTNLGAAQIVLQSLSSINRVEVRLADPFTARHIAAAIESFSGYDAESWQETNENYLKIFETQTAIANIVTGSILAVGGFGILAIQIMLVMQKIRDIAILRSIGLRKLDIMAIFFLQGVVIAIAGSILGSLLGWRAVEYLANIDVPSGSYLKRSHYSVYHGPDLYVLGCWFALGVGSTASLFPAWRGARVEPVEVLRGQI